MSQGAGVWTRIVAGLHGEVSAQALEGYRRAGAAVYDLLDRIQRRREEVKASGRSPWEADHGLQLQVAFSWNAFVLQTLGDEFIDADYAADSSTVGFLPRVTAEQVAAFYSQVEPWVSRANQAATNPDYEPDVDLPAELPHWVEVEPCPRAHLLAMMAALKSIRGRAQIAVGAFPEGQVPSEHRRRFGLVRQRIADADTAADYALQLCSEDPSQRLHEEVEKRIKAALEGYYVAGQMLAVPELVPAGKGQSPGVPPRPLPGPANSDFDPWCLTDPLTRTRWRGDARARKAIDNLWRWDPDPQATLHIQHAIDWALVRGDIASTKMHYFCCPWSPVFVAKRPVEIGGKRLRHLQQFTYDVSAEEMGEGGQFKREIVVANFEPTHRVDYCDPTEGGHHDDD
jgi:hypothetical protein